MAPTDGATVAVMTKSTGPATEAHGKFQTSPVTSAADLVTEDDGLRPRAGIAATIIAVMGIMSWSWSWSWGWGGDEKTTAGPTGGRHLETVGTRIAGDMAARRALQIKTVTESALVKVEAPPGAEGPCRPRKLHSR